MMSHNSKLSASIGRHGAYIWETKRILERYVEAESYDAVKKAVLEDNLLRKGSERRAGRSRGRRRRRTG
jgi:hypothetical protein